MTYMIDKIARAMHASVNGHVQPPPTWDNQSEQSQNYWRIGARAAIVAMREPSDMMIAEGHYIVDVPCAPDEEVANVIDIWEAMIDAALVDE